MTLEYSLVIPVYNRPDEIEELLESLSKQTYTKPYEVVIVEDGSTLPSDKVVDSYSSKLDIRYHFKKNTGPGHSRNIGMQLAKGNYFIVLDSDCILPPQYLQEVDNFLQQNYVDCFGGPDAAHHSFSDMQKAINYAMTSFYTTGGIRGNKRSVDKFQPRSFNMGISKKAFLATDGFGRIHPGEDPDLTIRIWNAGFKTAFVEKAFVFHKRRIDWQKFYKQVNKFGLVRPILNTWHPQTSRIVYWFPTFFISGLLFSMLIGVFVGNYLFLSLYAIYCLLLWIDSWRKNNSFKIAVMSIMSVFVQFWGYGTGFLKATFWVKWLGKDPELVFPNLFFKKSNG